MTLLDAKHAKPMTGGASYALGHRIFRVAWACVWWLFASWTPAPLHRWRVWLLRRFGADVHPSAHVYGSARIWYPPNLQMRANACLGPSVNCYSMAPILLCEKSIVSQGSHLCAGMHDIEDPNFQLIAKPIVIGSNAWVAAECFIGPGVTIGDGAVLGARGVLFKDAESHGVYAGNPAVLIKRRSLFQSGDAG